MASAKRRAWLLLVATLGFTSTVNAQAITVFSGVPSVKVSEGGLERTAENIPRERSADLACVVSQIGDKFYWASRENKLLARVERGAFITFVAIDGSGSIRLIVPERKQSAALMSDTESRFDYVEHLLIGLRSVTYYGISAR